MKELRTRAYGTYAITQILGEKVWVRQVGHPHPFVRKLRDCPCLPKNIKVLFLHGNSYLIDREEKKFLLLQDDNEQDKLGGELPSPSAEPSEPIQEEDINIPSSEAKKVTIKFKDVEVTIE